MHRVLVTGASGFVGSALCDFLVRRGYWVRAAYRTFSIQRSNDREAVLVGDISADTDWTAALAGIDLVVHAAARAHMLDDSPAHERLYMETNAEGTGQLAKVAAAAGVRRLIYVSTIKVNGEETTAAYTPADPPRPQDIYGRSKWAGEQLLHDVAAATGLEVAVVRPPLVYGPGVKANFLRLLKYVERGWPLPVAAVHNQRSLVSLENLCDLVERLLAHPAAPGRTWMVSDGEDLSTPELVKRIGVAMHRRAHMVSVPVSVLRWLGRLASREQEVARLCGSLCVDISDTRSQLGWAPLQTPDDAILRTVEWYLSRTAGNASS